MRRAAPGDGQLRRNDQLKILFLQKRILFPADAGCKLRTLNVLRHLAQWHEVTYLCNVQTTDQDYVDEMRALGVRLEVIPWKEVPRGTWRFYRDLAFNVLSPYPFNVAKDFDPSLRSRARQLLRTESYDLLICDFVQMARNALGLDVPFKVLFQHNVESQIFRRHALTDASWFRSWYMAQQWHKMQRFEGQAGREFDLVIAVSERDQQMFQQEYGWQHVKRIDTAVDVDYFQPNGVAEEPEEIVFVGQMDWLPNSDGARFFVQEVWPLIRSARPGATFKVVGRNPGPEVRRLGKVDGVEVVGGVPDVRPFLDRAAVAVVPLLVGGGTRLKIFEAMAMGTAVVSTTVGAEGLPITPGEHLMVADSAEAFSGKVIQLLDQPTQRQRLSRSALNLVRHRYTAEKVARQFDQICREAIQGADPKIRQA